MKRMVILIVTVSFFFGTIPSELFASAMVEVPGGSFIQGSTEASRTLEIPSFFIDRYETTNGEFAAHFPDHSFPMGAQQHPVSNVTWQQAQSYCEKQEKRLPTGAEWEKAARGTQGQIYPWGDKPLKKKPQPFFSGLIKRRVGYDKKDVSPYGVYNMAGSVWEWTADLDGGKAVTRGGLWNLHLDYEYSKTFDENRLGPDSRFIFLGFRCARSN